MEDDPNVEREILSEVKRLLEVYEESSATWIVVSNEVGLGIVPPTPLGRQYRDILGRAHQAVAARADRVYLTVAGLAMDLKSIAVPISGVSI